MGVYSDGFDAHYFSAKTRERINDFSIIRRSKSLVFPQVFTLQCLAGRKLAAVRRHKGIHAWISTVLECIYVRICGCWLQAQPAKQQGKYWIRSASAQCNSSEAAAKDAIVQHSATPCLPLSSASAVHAMAKRERQRLSTSTDQTTWLFHVIIIFRSNFGAIDYWRNAQTILRLIAHRRHSCKSTC